MLNFFILLFRDHIINTVTFMSLRRQITNDEEVSKTLKNSSTMTLLALKG